MADLFVDPWDLSEDAARERYQKLARRLNDNMRKMEKHGVTNRAVENYQSLVEDLTDGNKRLPKNVSAEDARTALLRVQDILDMRGSTWKETKEFALKGMNTFREKYGINFESVAQYNRFWSSENVQKLKTTYGSGAVLQAAQMQAADDDKLQQLAEDFLEADLVEAEDVLQALGFENQRELVRSMAERRRHNERRKSRNR